MARLESQMEDIMGYPTGGDPSIIDPTTGKPYDDSSRMRQQAEITRQADAMEAFQPVELPEYLKTKVEEKQSSPASEVSTDKLKTAYDDLVIPEKPLKRDSKGRPLESLRPKLRPTEDFGPSFNFKSPIDKTIELNYLLRDPNAKTKSKEIVSGLSEKTEEGERAVQGFYDNVAKGQGLSATEDAWCAAFVHYILTELGADTITSDGGYDAQRARKYVNYGSPVKIEDAQEGDIVIFDWNGDGTGQHVAFYAGTRITDQDNSNTISVVGGNQDDKVTLMTRNMSKVLGIRRITKDNINVSLSKDLAKNNPIFKLFVPAEVPAKDIKLKQGPRISNTQQADPFSVIPARYAEGGVVTNLERETEEALGLPPRAKYTSTAVQDTADLLDKEIAEAKSAGISQEPPTASDIANTVIDFTPVIGDIKGGVEGAEVIFEELGKDDPNFLLIGVVGGAGVVGLIPGVGDAAQKLIMQGARRFRKTELNPELMEILTPKDQETVQVLTKNTLPTPETDGERLADEVATMLREGKAGDITEEMLETAGNDFHTRLTQNYIDGNVGMDLPMDWESTMARSADQGLTETRYHGSNYKNLPYFKGEGARRGAGMFNSDNVFKALTYEGEKGETYSLLMRPLPKDSPEVDVRGASWSNLDKPPAEFELDARGYKIRQIGPDPESGPVLQGASTLRREQRLGEFLPEETGSLTTDSFMKKASELGYPGATVKNVEDVGASTPAGLPRDEAGIIRALAREPSQTQARTDTTGIRSVGARFDPRLTGLKNINMAQGGLTSMNDQTQMAFALGGEAETVDPVSGNDVPPGSLPEEVRDDIDAKLSEGEYVVPADVVRFFGVKYFEDLRTEAKMGLQQMDADGRIGGEPVQEQPQGQDDSMDVAELKAALSSSGMYAGGLTDGNSLDNFIDDASRSPMVNGRMRAGGASVKMAVGGLVPTGTYGDINKVDGIIKQLMTAANNDPALMEKLSSKGIMVNKTGADMKSAEMQQANKPQEPIEAAEGTLVQPRAFRLGGTTEADTSQQDSPFNLSSFNTLGQNLFEAAGITNPEKVVTDTFLNKEGKIEQIVLIAPDGSEVPVAWNNTMPLPPGFTRKATNDYGVKPAASTASAVAPVAISTQSPRKTGDESGPDPVTTTNSGTGFNAGKPEDYSNATIEELQAHLTTTKKYTKAGYLASFALGPVGMLIGIATKSNQAIVERRIENELKSRANKANTKNLRQINNLDNKALSEEEIDTLVVLQKSLRISNNLSKTGEIVATDNDGKPVGFNPVRSILNSVFEPMADRIDARVAASRIQGTADTAASSALDPMSLEPVMDPLARKAQQDLVTNSRLRREELERKAEEEARRAAQASANAERVRGSTGSYYTGDTGSSGERYFNTSGGGGGYTDSSGTNQYLGGGDQGWTNPTNEREMAARSSARAVSRGATSAPTRSDGKYSGSGRATGGLVSMLAAKKKKKKQTTQRRKGLGTRP